VRKKCENILMTRDNFLKVLSLDVKGKPMMNRERIDHFYKIMIDFLHENKAIDSVDKTESISSDLAFMIPGTSFHLRISTDLKEDVNALLIAYLVWVGIKQDSTVAVTVPVLMNIISRIRKLKIDTGEVCIMEALSEVNEKTATAICASLFGKTCRYSDSNCQFMHDDSCGMSLDAAEKTMEAMADQKVIKKMNHVEPFVWSVVL